MKTLRAANPGQRDKYFDKAALAQLDKDQGRMRLNAVQQQAMLYLSTGRWLVEEGFHGLENFLRAAGAWRRIRIALPLIKNALQLCADHMCSAQLISQTNNLENLTVTLSATPIATPGGGMLEHLLQCDQRDLRPCFTRVRLLCKDARGEQALRGASSLRCRAGTEAGSQTE